MFDYWKSKLQENDFEKFSFLINNGVNRSSLKFLIDFYFKIINTRGLKQKLENIINHVSSDIKQNKDLDVFLAETFSKLINGLVFRFDTQYINDNEVEELNGQGITFKYFNRTISTSDDVIKSLFESNDSTIDVNKIVLEKYFKWIEYLRVSVLVNCGFVSFNEEANDKLKGILQSLKVD